MFNYERIHIDRKKVKLRRQKEENLVLGRMVYSLLIIALYLLGKNIPIPWVHVNSATDVRYYNQNFIAGILGSTNENHSVLMLGIMPYMTASVIVSIFAQGRKNNQHTISPQKVQRATLLTALAVSILQGFLRAVQLAAVSLRTDYEEYRLNITYLPLEYILMTTVVLTAGAFITILLMDRNSRWGIGGSSLLIFVNILDSGRQSIWNIYNYAAGKTADSADPGRRGGVIIAICVMVLIILVITTLFERSDVRVPLRHVMINNAYAEKDYIAIKLNPIGTMPIMYVMSFFALPYYIFQGLSVLFPESRFLAEGISILNLNNVYGILIFALMLVVLTIAMSMFMIGPEDIAENLMKSGDYIEGFSPGEDTERELKKDVLFAAVLSSLVMIVTSVLPMLAGVLLKIPGELSNIPMTGMIIAGLMTQMADQIQNLRTMQKYKPFL